MPKSRRRRMDRYSARYLPRRVSSARCRACGSVSAKPPTKWGKCVSTGYIIAIKRCSRYARVQPRRRRSGIDCGHDRHSASAAPLAHQRRQGHQKRTPQMKNAAEITGLLRSVELRCLPPACRAGAKPIKVLLKPAAFTLKARLETTRHA
jgi:hypothetical protein